jgi:hypothetical protein
MNSFLNQTPPCNIHGIIINEVESLISLYADHDDTFLIIDESEHSLREALECFEYFYKVVSGLKSTPIINKHGESGSSCRQPLSREKKIDM